MSATTIEETGIIQDSMMVTRHLPFPGALLTDRRPRHLRRPPEIDILIAARRLPQHSAPPGHSAPSKVIGTLLAASHSDTALQTWLRLDIFRFDSTQSQEVLISTQLMTHNGLQELIQINSRLKIFSGI